MKISYLLWDSLYLIFYRSIYLSTWFGIVLMKLLTLFWKLATIDKYIIFLSLYFYISILQFIYLSIYLIESNLTLINRFDPPQILWLTWETNLLQTTFLLKTSNKIPGGNYSRKLSIIQLQLEMTLIHKVLFKIKPYKTNQFFQHN